MDKVVFNIGGVNIEMDKEEASKAIEAGEPIELKNDDLVTFTKDEYATVKSTLANDEYIKGRVDSAEMLQKAVKDKTGFDFSVKVVKNEKNNVDFDATANVFVNSITPLIEAKASIEPNEQVNELKGKLTSMQDNYTNLETEFNTYKGDITKKETRTNKDNTILGFIPDNIIVSKKIALLTLKSESGLDIGENGIALFNGETKRDKLEQDIKLDKDIVIEKLTTLGLIKKQEGGKGGDDELGDGKQGNYEKFVKEMENNNIQAGSEKFSLEMNKRLKEKTLVM